MVATNSRHVIKTNSFIPSSRTFLRKIFTVAKPNSTAIIAIKGFHSLQLFIRTTQLTAIDIASEASPVSSFLSVYTITDLRQTSFCNSK